MSSRFENFNNKYLNKIFIREQHLSKSSIVVLYQKLEKKHAIELAEAGQLASAPSLPCLHNEKATEVSKSPVPPEELDNIQELLIRNLYRIRQTMPSYSRHTLPQGKNSNQAKEIFLRRQESLLKDDVIRNSLKRRSVCLADDSQKKGKLARSLTVGGYGGSKSHSEGPHPKLPKSISVTPQQPSSTEWINEEESEKLESSDEKDMNLKGREQNRTNNETKKSELKLKIRFAPPSMTVNGLSQSEISNGQRLSHAPPLMRQFSERISDGETIQDE